jgi:ubiquinone biosynthesis protein UbiJ
MNPVMSALAQWCEAFVNGALSLDPIAEARMRRLDGRSFVIVSTAPEETFTVRCVGSRLLVARSEPHTWGSGGDAPNVIVTGTASALVAALTGIGTPDVTIEGDEALLDELRSIVRELEPDLARPLSPLIGAEPAAALSGFMSAGARAVRSMFAALDTEGTRWVRDTAHRRFAASAEVERFIERVTALRLAVDRLDARVRQLETRTTPSRGSA